MTKIEEIENSNGIELSSKLSSNCCGRNSRTEPRLELRGLLNKTKNKTRMEGIPPTRTRRESEVQEQGLDCLEQEWVQLVLTRVRSNGPHTSIYTRLTCFAFKTTLLSLLEA